MRLQLLSDLHFEFHADGGREFVAALDPTGVDVLVLAGDIATLSGLGQALHAFCERYADARVVYVHGNHEFYGTDRGAVLDASARASQANPNLAWLDGSGVEVQGHQILGAPLWFREDAAAKPYRRMMNDFSQIREFESWVYAENARAQGFLERELQAGDIVVTHHLPSARSIAPEFEGGPLNAFFLCDLEPLIVERKPALWLHGHTHASTDYQVGATRVVCNPFGYAGHELNPAFVDKLVIEV
jgi:predicted phosphodiesterase